MSTRKGLLGGSKGKKRGHTSVIKDAEEVITAARQLPEVSKIVISVIKPYGGSRRKLKLAPIPAGFRVTVRGTDGVQTLFIYTSDPKKTRTSLKNLFS